ncbi:MAG: ROK family protein, partial [Cohnella sp.]|nr:ROK family protein [Cohnella sp.]
MKIGAIEAGGTKFVCGIGNEKGTIDDYISFPTTHPEETLNKAIAYFRDKDVQAMGIGSFGPIGVTPVHSDYGYITATPKPDWSGFDLLGTLKKEIDVPYGWDTDVNAAAFGESKWGVAKNLDNCVYYTIGTGIGIGIYIEERLVHGLIHPEGGHIFTRRHPNDTYQGICPFHGDCLEGLASGKAIENRWSSKGDGLPKDHEAWELEAFYLSQAITN